MGRPHLHVREVEKGSWGIEANQWYRYRDDKDYDSVDIHACGLTREGARAFAATMACAGQYSYGG